MVVAPDDGDADRWHRHEIAFTTMRRYDSVRNRVCDSPVVKPENRIYDDTIFRQASWSTERGGEGFEATWGLDSRPILTRGNRVIVFTTIRRYDPLQNRVCDSS